MMIYTSKLAGEGFQSAKEFLDEIERGGAGFAKGALREDWIKAQKAWLTYSYLGQITSD